MRLFFWYSALTVSIDVLYTTIAWNGEGKSFSQLHDVALFPNHLWTVQIFETVRFEKKQSLLRKAQSILSSTPKRILDVRRKALLDVGVLGDGWFYRALPLEFSRVQWSWQQLTGIRCRDVVPEMHPRGDILFPAFVCSLCATGGVVRMFFTLLGGKRWCASILASVYTSWRATFQKTVRKQIVF